MDIKPDCRQLPVSDRVDPCAEDPAGRPEDLVFHGWDVPVFSEQDYLDLYTPFSGLTAADQRKEQVNVERNEEAAGTPAEHLRGPEVAAPHYRHSHPAITNRSCDDDDGSR